MFDQIGDPKMDSGCLEPGESLDQEFDMTKDILPEELIWLMDELLNREVCLNSPRHPPSLPDIGGMVDGLSIISDTLHLRSYRPLTLARSEGTR